MNQPVFSIITVTYNAEKTLEKTIQSVLNQTYTNIQYLIIDGGSKDGTLDIVKKYESRLSWISEPDKGLYDAMNKGLHAASGDYVWFMNAGDLIYANDTIEKIVKSILDAVRVQNFEPLQPETRSLPDIIYGETAIINASGEMVGMRRLKAPEKLNWKSFRMGMLVSHQSFIAKREIAEDYDLQYRYSADVDWCIRCMKKSKNIHNTHLILSRYLDEGMTTNNYEASLKERYAVMSKHYGRISTALFHLWFAVRFTFAKYVAGRV